MIQSKRRWAQEVFLMKRRNTWFFMLAGAMSCAGLVAACGGGGSSETGSSTSSGQGGGSAGGAGGEGGDGGGFVITGGGEQKLLISPLDPILDVTGQPNSLTFAAKLSDGSNPSALTWYLDDVTVGTIGGDGTFVSPGFVAGKAKVTAKSGMLEASTMITVRVKIVDNGAGISADDMTKLATGGSADPGFKWLYPYDRTIFPRGLTAPTLQFPGATDAMRIKITVGDFDYEGYFGGSNPARVDIPADVWKGATKSALAGQDVVVSATKLAGGAVTGPANETWRIAQGNLTGIVYYNTYVSPLANGGAVMRIKPGQNAEVLLGGCNVCHSVSANGNVLAAGVSWTNGNPLDSATYDLTQDGAASQRALDDDGRKCAFGGLTPDGTWMVSNGIPGAGSPVRGLGGDYPSRVFDTKTGMVVDAPSFTGAVQYALTPAFSPDGKHLAFSWYDATPGRTIATMDVDLLQSPPAFLPPNQVYTAPTGVAGWPSFTPDGNAVLFHEGDRFDTAGYGGTPSYGEIYMVDVLNKALNKLAALNGYDANGQFYLPFGDAEEARLDYEPTILPVAVGGYYWVFFTSRRAYGNTIGPGGTVPDGDNKWGKLVNGGEVPSPRKKIWVAAIDVDWQGKADPSHPAFYFPGQELEAGNMRAFAALEPCKDLGQACESAAQCCNGNVCRPADVNGDGVMELACVTPPMNECAQETESCETAADCCNGGSQCAGNRCVTIPPK
jgi:WD40-like Beta Propeller Repeat